MKSYQGIETVASRVPFEAPMKNPKGKKRGQHVAAPFPRHQEDADVDLLETLHKIRLGNV